MTRGISAFVCISVWACFIASDAAAAPATVLPGQVTVLQGTCTNYNSTLGATGAVDTNGGAHPGACQYSDYVPTIGGKPADQFLQDVRGWRESVPYAVYRNGRDASWSYAFRKPRGPSRQPELPPLTPRPYKVAGTPDPFGQQCVRVVGLGADVSATVRVSQLTWAHGRPAVSACAKEWDRQKPLSGGVQSAADQVVQNASTKLLHRIGKEEVCAANRSQAEIELAQEIERFVEESVQWQEAQWQTARLSADNAGACTMHCGLCDGTGWAGRIQCTIEIAMNTAGYRHNEKQTWLVGGTPQASGGSSTNYPVAWSAVGGGSHTGGSWSFNHTQATDLTVTVLPSSIPIFDRTTNAIRITNGIAGTPTSFRLDEIDFPAIVANTPNPSEVIGTWSRPTDAGDGPQQPGPIPPATSNGTLTCEWDLSR